MAGESIKFNASIDTAGFDSGAKRLQSAAASASASIAGHFGKIATAVVGIGAAFVGVQQAVAAFNSALSMGGRLDDLSKTTGASAGELLLLEKAFELAGSSAEAVGPSIARLSRFMVEASTGGAAQIETMNKLGLSYAQLKDLTPTEQMRLLAKSIMALPTPAERTAAAMDIFGRSGSTLIPLFANFSGELDKAQGYLGSLPGLLDESASAMADIEDDLGALGDKFNQFVAGLVAGAAGVDNFASALAKIDTAGIGAGFGEQLRVAFDAPLATSKAIGYVLLTGAKEAGNALINATAFSAEMFVKTISAKEYAIGLGERIRAALMEAVNAFNKILAYGVEKIFLQPLSNLPGIIGDPFRAALASVQEIQKTLDATSRENFALWNEGGEKIQGSINDAKNSTEILSKDWLGVEQSAADAARHILEAQEKGSANIAQDMSRARVDAEAIAQALERAKQNPFSPLFDSSPDAPSSPRPEFKPPGIFGMDPKDIPAPSPGSPSPGRGGGAEPKPKTAMDRIRDAAAQMDVDAMTEESRMRARGSRGLSRADELEDAGHHRTAAQIRAREERRRERDAKNFEDRQAKNSRREELEKMGPLERGRAEQEARKLAREQERMAKEGSKTEKEREREEKESGGGGGGGGGKPSSAPATESTLAKILSKIQERPILVA